MIITPGKEFLEYVLYNFRHTRADGSHYLTFEDVKKRALQLYAHRDEFAYLYGTDGQIATEELIERQFKKYPGHFATRDLNAIREYTLGKVVFDCSGFIHTIFDAPDKTSLGIITDCSDVSTDLAAGVEGSVLFKPGHVGLDIGAGVFIDTATECDTFRLKIIREYDWVKSGKWIHYADYTGATND